MKIRWTMALTAALITGALFCSNGAYSQEEEILIVDGGKEFGGMPPADSDGTVITIPASFAQIIAAPEKWSVLFQLAEQAKTDGVACALSYADDGDRFLINLKGVRPGALRERAVKQGLALPTEASLDAFGSENSYCESFEQKFNDALTDQLGALIDEKAIPGTKYDYYTAKSISCLKEYLGERVSCIFDSEIAGLSQLTGPKAEALYASLAAIKNHRPLFDGFYHVRDVECSSMELVAPGGNGFTRRWICTFDQAIAP